MSVPIRALIFDFDGLILDTETAEQMVWKRIYAEYGFEYPIERGVLNIGHWGFPGFDPAMHLHELTRDSLNVEALKERHREESRILTEQQPIGEGVLDYIQAARRLRLHVVIASSAYRYWVEDHLKRLDLLGTFDGITTRDDVPHGRHKPEPDIYLKALEQLGLRASQAIALEDSPPGIAAARAAGVFVVAVPSPTTALLDLSDADLIIPSLRSIPLEELLQKAVR